MARRNRRTQPRETPRAGGELPRSDRPGTLGQHWRADGMPKVAYGSQGEALAVADERRQDAGVELSVYRCQYCSAWHLGNASGRER